MDRRHTFVVQHNDAEHLGGSFTEDDDRVSVNEMEDNDSAEDKQGPMEKQLAEMSPEKFRELILKMAMMECENDEGDNKEENYDLEQKSQEEDSNLEVEKVQEKKKQTKISASKQERKPATKTSKQYKNDPNPDNASVSAEKESKPKKGRSKKAEAVSENGTDVKDHLLPDQIEEGTPKKERNKKQLVKEKERMDSDYNTVKEAPLLKEELKPKRNKAKLKVMAEENEDNHFTISSVDAGLANETSKKSRKGKGEQTHKEEATHQGTQDNLIKSSQKKQNKVKDDVERNNSETTDKENMEDLKPKKTKSKFNDNSSLKGVKGYEPKVAENKTGKSVKPLRENQTNKPSKLNENSDSKHGQEEDDVGSEKNIIERPKRNIKKQDYTEKEVMRTALKNKKEINNPKKQTLQDHSNEPESVNIPDNSPKGKSKPKAGPKGKNYSEEQENKAKSEKAITKKRVTRKK